MTPNPRRFAPPPFERGLKIEGLRVGERFAKLCARGGYGAVHSVFDRVVNIRAGGELFSVTAQDVGCGARYLNTAAPTLRHLDFRAGDPCAFDSSGVTIGELRVTIEHAVLWEPPTAFLEKSETAAAGAAGLIGLGPGLTPSGDDILLGYLAVMNRFGRDDAQLEALKHEIARNLHRTTDLSAQALSDALDGAYCEAVENVLAALEALLKIGATRGADMAYGMCAAIEQIVGFGAADARPLRGFSKIT